MNTPPELGVLLGKYCELSKFLFVMCHICGVHDGLESSSKTMHKAKYLQKTRRSVKRKQKPRTITAFHTSATASARFSWKGNLGVVYSASQKGLPLDAVAQIETLRVRRLSLPPSGTL